MSQSENQRTQSPRVALIRARWHADIVDKACDSFVDAMGKEAGVTLFDVPGAFEIPLLAKRLAKTGQYDAIVAAAFVIDGGIYRHDFVASTVVSGLMQVQLETDVPVLSVVLTPHQFHETEEHHKFFSEHFVLKGQEAASACQSLLAMMPTARAAA